MTRVDVTDLFDRFSSADRSPHSVGLGLWIVRLLAQVHGGEAAYDRLIPGPGSRQPAETYEHRPRTHPCCGPEVLISSAVPRFRTGWNNQSRRRAVRS
jgi:hypothetical protein